MQIITATQELTAADRERLRYIKKTFAFEEWRQRLNPNDQLPRGRFFKGKKAGPTIFLMDEFWQTNAANPYDLRQFRFQDGRTEIVDVSKAKHVFELGGFAPEV